MTSGLDGRWQSWKKQRQWQKHNRTNTAVWNVFALLASQYSNITLPERSSTEYLKRKLLLCKFKTLHHQYVTTTCVWTQIRISSQGYFLACHCILLPFLSIASFTVGKVFRHHWSDKNILHLQYLPQVFHTVLHRKWSYKSCGRESHFNATHKQGFCHIFLSL